MPQWSPPMNGGSTMSASLEFGYISLAAMEPADERREHEERAPRGWRWDAPQWSPPMNGGSTPIRTHSPSNGATAAMEPADERREHDDRLDALVWAFTAAMEPADERREHSSAPRGMRS